jgi:nucleoside-diphosphate-sugar epimerase
MCQNWLFKSHKEVKYQPNVLNKTDVIVNLGVSSDIASDAFNVNDSLDVFLAHSVLDMPKTRLVTISTRQIYGEACLLSEKLDPFPTTQYGKNKLAVEKYLCKLLSPSQLTILRCSNVFGFELGRKTFFGTMLTSLSDDDFIKFNISPDTKKDFIPIEDCCEIIFQVVSKKVTGIFNVGSGISVRSGDLAQAVIKGFGSGEFICDSELIDGQFQMDISSLRALIDYPPITTDLVLLNATKIGCQLREHAL